jgi:hypothetical protein
MLDDVATHVIPHLVGIPDVVVEQPLHAVGCAVPGELGQRPTVLPLRLRQQPQQIIPRPQPRLPLREPAGDPREHVVKRQRPTLQVYA